MASIKKIQGPATFHLELSQEEVNYLSAVLAHTSVDELDFPEIKALDKHLFRLFYDNEHKNELSFDGQLVFEGDME